MTIQTRGTIVPSEMQDIRIVIGIQLERERPAASACSFVCGSGIARYTPFNIQSGQHIGITDEITCSCSLLSRNTENPVP